MSVLGEAYRILYVSSNKLRGLTDIYAVVLKPDLSQAGVFPMIELGGMFHGVYYYDYFSSTSDPEGSYFSLVNSPTEKIDDIVRFQLDVGSAGGDSAIVIPPTSLVAYITDQEIEATLSDESDLWAYARVDQILGQLTMNERVVGVIGDTGLEADVNSNSTIAVLDR